MATHLIHPASRGLADKDANQINLRSCTRRSNIRNYFKVNSLTLQTIQSNSMYTGRELQTRGSNWI